jgi:small subunit ribosomal protein S3Ae
MVTRLAEDKDEKKEQQRPSARKVKDKWRAKEWYKVFAPEMFGGQQIAETFSADPSLLEGRVVSVALQDITGDFSKMHIKLNLRINRVAGFEAHTEFVGHDLTSDYIRRLTRRKHSKMDGVFEARTKDGYVMKVKPMAITEKRIQTSQQKAIRHLMSNVVSTAASKQTMSELVKDVLSGDMAKNIFKECKPVYPIRKIEIRRTEITVIPEPSELPPAAPAEGAPAAGAPPAPPSPDATAPVAEGALPVVAPHSAPPSPPLTAPAAAPAPKRTEEELLEEEE